MEYDFVITDQTTKLHEITLATSLENTINLFGVKVEIPYDITKIIINDVSNNSYTWSFPFDVEQLPDISYSTFATAFFMDSSGNTQEIKKAVDASNITFDTTLTKTIDLFGIKVDVPYDTSGILIKDVSGNNYTWDLPFNPSNFPTIGPSTVIATAFFMDTCGNTQEISGNFIAYNLGKLSTTRDYYIQLRADINKEIYQDSHGNYGIYGATIDKNNESYDISYVLPIGTTTLYIKTMEVYDFSDQTLSLGDYDIVVDLSTTEIGDINSLAYFTPSSTTPATVQTSSSSSPVSSTSVAASLDNYYSNRLTAMTEIYDNKTVFTDWEMKILDAYPSSDSIVNQVNSSAGGTKSLPNFFDEGENITLALGYDLELSISDICGNKQVIIPETKIYAVITQDSDAPRLNNNNN